MSQSATLKEMANAIRALSMDAVQAANSGHPGAPMGQADIATVLFTKFLKFDPNQHKWADRDRFVLSSGHGSMLIYSALYLAGYPGITMDDLSKFRQLGSKTAGHPEYGHVDGIEVTTGPLGQGIATAVGMALGERMLNAKYGDELVDHYTYVIAGDGCLMEGISHEAAGIASHMKLGKLILLWDDNSITIDGGVDVSSSDDTLARFAAYGWDISACDGHNPDEIEAAISAARKTDQPSIIACKTIIGYGAPSKQGTSATHGAPLGADEIAATRKALGWTSPAFEVPENILNAWRSAGARGVETRQAWDARLAASDKGEALQAQLAGIDTAALDAAIAEVKKEFAADKPVLATRQSSAKVLDKLYAAIPGLVGGSADLSGSNGTKTGGYKAVTAEDYDGNYIHYGVREFGMGTTMNGLALHGGVTPLSGTFLVFADYSRPSIRLAALMGVQAIHVLTHDSIGLGEDGPTHQPVEHLASLRAMPNTLVFRPGDLMEMAETWECALKATTSPSCLALSRQGMPALRSDAGGENLTAKGAYVLREADGARDVTLMGTGTELHLAVEAAEVLKSKGIKAAVVSMPCWELFEKQDHDYRQSVLGTAPRVAVEAAVKSGWDRWLSSHDVFIGMSSFGASAPADQLYKHFGITTDAVVAAAEKLVK